MQYNQLELTDCSDHPGHDPICSPSFKEGQGGRQISVEGFIESEVGE